MFIGGSVVCCVDEVFFGLDFLFCRKIWDIFFVECGRCIMILMMYFLDEVDLLVDYIVVMFKGNFCVSGILVEFKDCKGGGYRIYINNNKFILLFLEVEGVIKKVI